MATASSAQDSSAAKQLKPAVITATRSEKDPNETARSVTIITAEDIRKSGANSLAEALSLAEGIYIVGTGQNPGMNQSLFMRGTNSNQTVVLIDGMRMTDPSLVNDAPDLLEISLADIDRIEIVRGSHSSLYGSSAIGGVINIITRKTKAKGLAADAKVMAGSFGSGTAEINEDVYLNYTFQKGFYASGEILNQSVSGMNATIDTVTDPSVYKHPDVTDNFKRTNIIGKIGFKNEKADLYVSYKLASQLADIDKAAYRDDDNYTIDFQRNLFAYGLSYKLNDKWKCAFQGGFSDMKRTSIDDSSLVDANGAYDHTYQKGIFEGHTVHNELQVNYATKNFSAVAGGGSFSEEMDINTYYYSPFFKDTSSLDSLMPRVTMNNFFLHADLGGAAISEKLQSFSLAAGLRNTMHSLVGNNLTWEISPSVRIGTEALLYASLSTGFNAPSLYQLYSPEKYYTWDLNYTTGLSRGNKGLKPETSSSVEVGFKQNLGEKLSIAAAYFTSEIKNNIEYVYLWDKNIGIDTLGQNWTRDDYRGDRYLNLGTLSIRGAEFSIRSKVSDKISIQGSVSIVGGKIDYSGSDIDTSQTHGNRVQIYSNGAFLSTGVNVQSLSLPRRPGTSNFMLTYLPGKKLALSAIFRYVGARPDIFYDSAIKPYGALNTVGVEQYSLFDLLVRYEIVKGFSASLRVENAFDTKYSEINGYSTRGRGFYFTLRYSL